MKPVRAATSFRISQCRLQVIFAEKPFERAQRLCRPFRAIIRPRCGNAGGNCRRRLDRLLIECFWLLAMFAEALGTDRSKVSR
jgi:hypothetical protein